MLKFLTFAIFLRVSFSLQVGSQTFGEKYYTFGPTPNVPTVMDAVLSEEFAICSIDFNTYVPPSNYQVSLRFQVSDV